MRPEHLYARRSKGCESINGQVSWLEEESVYRLRANALDGVCRLFSLQWRDRAGFAPASLFSPLLRAGHPDAS